MFSVPVLDHSRYFQNWRPAKIANHGIYPNDNTWLAYNRYKLCPQYHRSTENIAKDNSNEFNVRVYETCHQKCTRFSFSATYRIGDDGIKEKCLAQQIPTFHGHSRDIQRTNIVQYNNDNRYSSSCWCRHCTRFNCRIGGDTFSTEEATAIVEYCTSQR